MLRDLQKVPGYKPPQPEMLRPKMAVRVVKATVKAGKGAMVGGAAPARKSAGSHLDPSTLYLLKFTASERFFNISAYKQFLKRFLVCRSAVFVCKCSSIIVHPGRSHLTSELCFLFLSSLPIHGGAHLRHACLRCYQILHKRCKRLHCRSQ